MVVIVVDMEMMVIVFSVRGTGRLGGHNRRHWTDWDGLCLKHALSSVANESVIDLRHEVAI